MTTQKLRYIPLSVSSPTVTRELLSRALNLHKLPAQVYFSRTICEAWYGRGTATSSCTALMSVHHPKYAPTSPWSLQNQVITYFGRPRSVRIRTSPYGPYGRSRFALNMHFLHLVRPKCPTSSWTCQNRVKIGFGRPWSVRIRTRPYRPYGPYRTGPTTLFLHTRPNSSKLFQMLSSLF